jgi:flagellar motor protein MotB
MNYIGSGDDDYGDENMAWPSYVDFLSAFSFVLFIFIGFLLYMLYGQVPEQLFKIRTSKFVGDLRGKDPNLAPRVEGMRLVWDLSKKLNFRDGSAELGAAHRRYLTQVARELPRGLAEAGPDCRVVVLGTADSRPFQNDPFGNWNLSAQRALSVLRFLYSCNDCGYGAEIRKKLTLSGEGDTRANTRVTSQDRRVDLVIDCTPNAKTIP